MVAYTPHSMRISQSLLAAHIRQTTTTLTRIAILQISDAGLMAHSSTSMWLAVRSKGRRRVRKLGGETVAFTSILKYGLFSVVV